MEIRLPAPVVLRPTTSLRPNPRNAKLHPADQVKLLRLSFKRFGFLGSIQVIPDPDDAGAEIWAGEGRWLAAAAEKMPRVPTVDVSHLTEQERREFQLADNELARMAGYDEDKLRLEVGDLSALGVDIASLGFSNADALLGEQETVENYSRKIVTPVYKITGDAVDVAALLDDTKAQELRAEIDAADLPDDVSAFLNAAADRHTVFHFRNIAEFYAQADAATQRLMERSALVIIDFDQAVESGFIKLNQGMMDQAEEAKARADAN